MKKLPVIIMTVTLIFAFMAGCATYRVRFESAGEWIEGKPYPVQISMKKTDKVADVVVHYSFNGVDQKTIPLEQMGTSFSYTIPGDEVLAGTLRYSITYTVKGKAKASETATVRVLTLQEASEKYARQLSSRIAFSPPEEVPENRDLPLAVTISSTQSSTEVTFYFKAPENGSFQEKKLRNDNGTFSTVLSSNDLQAGINTFYFEVKEDHPDVGTLQVFVGGRTDENPFQFTILTLEQIQGFIERELASSLSHSVPRDVYPTRDLQLSLDVNYPQGSYLAEYSQQALTVELFYRASKTEFKQAKRGNRKGRYDFIVPAGDLKAGYNTYYFSVSDEMEDIGTVYVDFPVGENLFTYNILTMDEIRQIKERSLAQRLSHQPVTEVTGIEDLTLKVTLAKGNSNASGVLLFRKPKAKGKGKGWTKTNMTNEGGTVLTGIITADQQQKGVREYYFQVSEPDPDLGTVSVKLPAQGEQNPFKFTMMDRNEVMAMLQAELQGRISHRPVTNAAEGEDLLLTVEIKNPVRGTVVDFYQRKSGDRGYQKTRIAGSGSQFTMIMPKADIRAGFNQYFFEVQEPNPYFNFLKANLGTAATPYEFEITRLKDAVLEGIDFTPLSDVEYGEPVEARITLNNNPKGTRVFFLYRLSDDTIDYLTVQMNQEGNDYTAQLSPALLKESGRIDYYMRIELLEDTFTYPDEKILPLYFTVKEQLVEETAGEETVFGTTGRSEENMLEGRIFQLNPGTKNLPPNMHRDYESLIILYTRKLDIPARGFTEGFPGLENIFEWFGVQYRGLITVQDSGLYKFRLHSDDGSKLFIDSIMVINNDGTHAPRSVTGEIYLSPGTYPIRVDYFQGPRMQIALQMFATKPGEEEKLFDLTEFE